MTQKFSGSELLQMAIQLEKEGKEFYTAVMESVKDPKAKEIFQFLANEEVKHEEIFREMLSKGQDVMLSLPYDDYEMLLSGYIVGGNGVSGPGCSQQGGLWYFRRRKVGDARSGRRALGWKLGVYYSSGQDIF